MLDLSVVDSLSQVLASETHSGKFVNRHDVKNRSEVQSVGRNALTFISVSQRDSCLNRLSLCYLLSNFSRGSTR